MHKLLKIEAVIFEGLKDGKTKRQIVKENPSINESTLTARFSRMVELGFLTREGKPKQYIYKVVDLPYEVIEKREAEKVPNSDVDSMLINMAGFKLTEMQVQFLRDNYNTMTRSELSKRLGIAKLELNHAMHNLELKQKGVK